MVVLDEMPYLIRTDPGFEGTLQKAFDRELSRKPALLVCVGSDLAMMEALNEYGRPFHQRATELVVPPLSPADAAEMLELRPADAFDAYLVSGGLPLILDEWPAGMTALDYVADAVTDPLGSACGPPGRHGAAPRSSRSSASPCAASATSSPATRRSSAATGHAPTTRRST